MSTFDRTALIKRYQADTDAGDAAWAPLAVLLVGGRDLVDDALLAECAGRTGIRWPAVLENGGWGSTDEILVRTAVSLWKSGDFEVSVGQAVATMDDRQFALWQAMIQARWTGKIPAEYR